MKPSSSSGSQSSFIRFLASSLVSFSPRLVVELEDLHKVVESTLILGVLGGLEHGVAVGLGEHLLALLGLSADLGDGLEGGVDVAGSHQIAGVEGVNLTISLEVID